MATTKVMNYKKILNDFLDFYSKYHGGALETIESLKIIKLSNEDINKLGFDFEDINEVCIDHIYKEGK